MSRSVGVLERREGGREGRARGENGGSGFNDSGFRRCDSDNHVSKVVFAVH